MKGLGLSKKFDYKEIEGMGFLIISLVKLGVQKKNILAKIYLVFFSH